MLPAHSHIGIVNVPLELTDEHKKVIMAAIMEFDLFDSIFHIQGPEHDSCFEVYEFVEKVQRLFSHERNVNELASISRVLDKAESLIVFNDDLPDDVDATIGEKHTVLSVI